jgi:hypothetical protein
MNHSRKFLTWVYVAAIVVTAYFAPWEKTIHVGEVGLMMVQELDSPLWEIPTIKENQNPGRMPVTRELTQSEIESLKSQGIDPTGLTAAVDKNQGATKIRLRTEVLVMEWIAISLIYGATYLALTGQRKKPVSN